MKVRKKILGNLVWDIISCILLILPFVVFVLPVATYKHFGNTYAITGLPLLTGGSICQGTVVIKPNVFFIIAIILNVLALVALLVWGRKKSKLAAEIHAIAAVYGFIAPIVMASKMNTILFGAKSVAATYGIYIMAVPAFIALIIALIKLSDCKVLCALDFMVLPGMLYFFVNNYIPMFGLYISFKKIDYSVGLWKSPWVGLKNFKDLFTNARIWIITRNTIVYNVIFIILGIVFGIIVGICLSEVAKKFMQKTYQTLILLPQLISFVIISYIVYAFLSKDTGLINQGILHGENVQDFYSKTVIWPFVLIFINQWKMLGYNSIVFLASIVGIDRSLYEAARVDGASKWKQIRYVTIPQLRPTIVTLFLLQCGRIFYSDFGLFYLVPMDRGALYDVTDTVDTFVYRYLMVNNNLSLSSAASTYQAIVGFILVLVVNLLVKKFDKENALF